MNVVISSKEKGLVIGSAGQIGTIICQYLDKKGKSYSKTYFSSNKKGIQLNLEDRNSIDSFLSSIKTSKLDFIIFNASITPKSYKNDAYNDFSVIKRIAAVNVTSLIYLVENLEKYKISVRSFIILCSESALKPTRRHIAYNASKASQLNIYYSFKEKYDNISWYIMLLSKSVENDYKKIINEELQKILCTVGYTSRAIFFSKRRNFFHKVFLNFKKFLKQIKITLQNKSL